MGKVDVTKEQMVFAEATSVLPLIASDAPSKKMGKKRKKKFSKIFNNKWNIWAKKRFFRLRCRQNFNHKVTVVPFGLEKTVSYGGGTKNGPKEIIKASHQVELFDEELNKEPRKEIGIKTLKPFTIKNIKQALNQLSQINKKIIESNKFPLVFGGEHSITPGSIEPLVKKYGDITLLHFDAHADLEKVIKEKSFSRLSN